MSTGPMPTGRSPVRRIIVAGAAILLVAVGFVVVRSQGTDHVDTDAVSGACTAPSFTTSAKQTVWHNGGYRVEPDMWNSTVGTQTLRACSYRSWYVTASQPDTPSVKVYPDVNLELHGARLDTFSQITSRYGSHGPGTGVYEYAYDIWLNGIADEHSTEIMIWTDTHGNVLHVPQRGTFTSRARTYSAYRAGRFIAYVDTANSSSGELDLRSFFYHAISRGWLPTSARIRRIEFGVEICSTGGVPMDFGVTDFSVETG
jgi:hypothetical protein